MVKKLRIRNATPILIIALFGFIPYGVAQEHQESGDSNFDLMGVQFVDSKTGWATGIRVTDAWTGIVLHTTDSGRHWKVQHAKADVGLENVFFIDKKSGWVTGQTEWGWQARPYIHRTEGRHGQK